jgi:hypothetical protein
MGPDLVDVLAADHREFEELLAMVAPNAPEPVVDEDRHLAATIAEIVRHTIVEEDYLYPLVDQVVPDGHGAAGTALEQSKRIELLLKQLDRRPSQNPDHDRLLAELTAMIDEHIELTEGHLFPALRHIVEYHQLEHLAGVVEMAKRTAPTHPHPGAPHDPPWNLILTPGIGLVDRVRDAMTGRVTKPDKL